MLRGRRNHGHMRVRRGRRSAGVIRIASGIVARAGSGRPYGRRRYQSEIVGLRGEKSIGRIQVLLGCMSAISQIARRRKHFGRSQQRAGESLEDCRVRLGLYDVDRMERTQRAVNVVHSQKQRQR